MKTHYKPSVSILETKNSELVRAGRDDKKNNSKKSEKAKTWKKSRKMKNQQGNT